MCTDYIKILQVRSHKKQNMLNVLQTMSALALIFVLHIPHGTVPVSLGLDLYDCMSLWHFLLNWTHGDNRKKQQKDQVILLVQRQMKL